jgi:hypothetical protein
MSARTPLLVDTRVTTSTAPVPQCAVCAADPHPAKGYHSPHQWAPFGGTPQPTDQLDITQEA